VHKVTCSPTCTHISVDKLTHTSSLLGDFKTQLFRYNYPLHRRRCLLTQHYLSLTSVRVHVQCKYAVQLLNAWSHNLPTKPSKSMLVWVCVRLCACLTVNPLERTRSACQHCGTWCHNNWFHTSVWLSTVLLHVNTQTYNVCCTLFFFINAHLHVCVH
jgi:hypothetical protein